MTRIPDNTTSFITTGDERLRKLVLEWQRLLNEGKTVAPEELCHDCPELLDALYQEIRTVGSLQPNQTAELAQHTVPWLQVNGPKTAASKAPLTQVGRYQIESILGQGGFAIVYLAHDEQLQRQVAIKVPHGNLLRGPDEIDAYLNEARTVAALDHPNIVPVYDVGTSENCPFFIVSKFIEGCTLRKKINEERASLMETVRLTAVLAETLHYAHRQGLVHRDIKPSNILLDVSGKPYVADFGMALKDENIGLGPRYAGTVPYMSPEQARGEGHRVDGRSDIFSLGIVFYEQLTGRRPFHGKTSTESLEQITTMEPRPPRQWDDAIPRELERICLRSLMKRASERYSTAGDMAEDLRHFLEQATAEEQVLRRTPVPPETSSTASTNASVDSGTTPATDREPLRIIPKGLRSFDEHDADFFLELMPGPRDRSGLPDSIRFWKNAIECLDADRTFSVGLIYGPSGCGKSSLVKAGLLPRLAKTITAIYIEATAEETEKRLLVRLRKQFPELGGHLGLKETLTALRHGKGQAEGRKTIIVFDQFEQWLHARPMETNTELVQALRQCDGANVQCIIMVRDDFWLAATRFLGELEVDLVQGKNTAVADLLDLDHARKVLTALGRAFGKLPEGPQSLPRDQKDFLQQAVKGLARDGKVTCIHLALFAEMIKGKPWTPATLKAIGGMQGVGVNFLDETFSSQASNPKHRLHRKAACAVLSALLPETGADIKGNMRSHAQLLAASGYAGRPKEFADLLQILDRETGLITPTTPEAAGTDDVTPTNYQLGERYYQLTHDYLVPSLRDWLTRTEKERWSGRLRLRLVEQSALWNSKPERRYLPSALEWASMRLLLRSRELSQPQRRMMKSAGRYHVARLLGIAALAFLLVWGAWEFQGRLKARALTESLFRPGLTGVTPVLDEMSGYRRWVQPLLMSDDERARAEGDAERQLKWRLALLRWDPAQANAVYEALLHARAQDFAVLRAELAPYKQEFSERLWTTLADTNADADQRFRAACALAGYEPDDPRWAQQGPFIVNKLAAEDALALKDWKDALDPVGLYLLPAQATALELGGEDPAQQRRLFELYAGFCAGRPEGILPLESRLAQLLQEKNGADTSRRAANAAASLVGLEQATAAWPLSILGDDPILRSYLGADTARRTANVAASLVGLKHATAAWPLLIHGEDPTLRSYLIERLGLPFIDPKILEQRLAEESDISARRALILALASARPDRGPDMVPVLTTWYANEADPGIHGAAGYVLAKWGLTSELSKIEKELATGKVEGGRRWYLSKSGQTFSVIQEPGAMLLHGGPSGAPVIHRFAIAEKETTVEQFHAILPGDKHEETVARTPGSPVNVSWHQAAAYCNRLSDEEKIPRNQWCYRQIDKDAELYELVPGYQKLVGYRLPTNEEWGFACRAGTKTLWSFGVADKELASQYAWWSGNSQAKGIAHSHRVASLKPNDLGLFDMHGNVAEWCQEIEQPSVKIKDDVWAAVRGGYFSVHYAYLAYDRAIPYPRKHLSKDIGFRVARTLP